ncbi:MAG: peptide-methionine (S)-S-oxide reductase MsrA [Proteobacteria bacterium]|nr:peptide-methionine (S)-S-oxide reductase MsrA [Pseudomonadota bacterium]MDA1131801.1 peptide-methionine (S)-S-oxide reductase MsrA [Pseudomonadota bacterium]
MAGFQTLRVDPDQVPAPAFDPAPEALGPQTAVLAGGCFWCTEAVFKELDGVASVRTGYAGGTADTANYDAVCSGATDHAEAIEITYDPTRTSFGEILRVFFSVAHDPTQMNRQGNDRGRQYRSAIFPADELQERIARAYIAQLEQAQVYSAPIKTRIEPATEFFAAEAAHQDYAARNPRQGYIVHVANPKLDAMRKYFAARLRGR